MKLITGPATEPVSLTEAKLNARYDAADLDALFTIWIKSARELAEHELQIALITQVWELALDEFPSAEILLPKYPLISITSVKYDNAAAVEQTLSSSLYTTDTYQMPPWLVPAINTEWPDTLDEINSVRIRYSVGFGAASDVPSSIKEWMLARINDAFENPSAMVEGRMAKNPYLDGKLDAYRNYYRG